MKTTLLILTVFISSLSFAHNYFFAFVELDFNENKNLFEATLTASAHDLEDVLNEVGIPVKELEDHYSDSVMSQKIESFILDHFTVYSNGKVVFKLVGFEVNKQGLVNFYFTSTSCGIPEKTIEIRFDFLMDQLPEQQNKLTYLTDKEQKTTIFLQNKRTQIIQL